MLSLSRMVIFIHLLQSNPSICPLSRCFTPRVFDFFDFVWHFTFCEQVYMNHTAGIRLYSYLLWYLKIVRAKRVNLRDVHLNQYWSVSQICTASSSEHSCLSSFSFSILTRAARFLMSGDDIICRKCSRDNAESAEKSANSVSSSLSAAVDPSCRFSLLGRLAVVSCLPFFEWRFAAVRSKQDWQVEERPVFFCLRFELQAHFTEYICGVWDIVSHWGKRRQRNNCTCYYNLVQ